MSCRETPIPPYDKAPSSFAHVQMDPRTPQTPLCGVLFASHLPSASLVLRERISSPVASNVNKYLFAQTWRTHLPQPLRRPPLNEFMHRYGTPLTAGLVTVSVASGIALFFHSALRSFHGMHEWFSMLLLASFVLHLWKNWKRLAACAKRKALFVPLGLSLVVAVPFAVMSGKECAGKPASHPLYPPTKCGIR